MKTIGIIGGFGPETTAKFFMSLISLWQKKDKNIRPEILIWNAPVNSALEKEFVVSGKNSEHFLTLLKAGVEKMERAGAKFLVIPCNSLHIFIEEIRSSTSLEVISIVEETFKFLHKNHIQKVGVLSSGITNKSRLFENAKNKTNISILKPNLSDQAKLDKIIHRLVLGNSTNSDQKLFIKISKKLSERGIRNILLGCTDFQLLEPKLGGVKFIDTLDILAIKAIEKMIQE